ncbi:hypothetical protein GQR58_018537 [Nymphon striatum]|nr:hypothetical protein GQR58_018537 [Nymphon striatum]
MLLLNLVQVITLACAVSAQHWPQRGGETVYGNRGWTSVDQKEPNNPIGPTTNEDGYVVYHASSYPQTEYKQATDTQNHQQEASGTYKQAFDLNQPSFTNLGQAGYQNPFSMDSLTPTDTDYPYQEASSQNVISAVYPQELDGTTAWNSTNFASGSQYFPATEIKSPNYQQTGFNSNWNQQYSSGENTDQTRYDQRPVYEQQSYQNAQNVVEDHQLYNNGYEDQGNRYSNDQHQFEEQSHGVFHGGDKNGQRYGKPHRRPDSYEHFEFNHHGAYVERPKHDFGYEEPKAELVPRQTGVLLDALGTLENAVEFKTSFFLVPVTDLFTTTVPSTTGGAASSFSTSMIFNTSSILLIGVLVVAAVILFPAIGGYLGINNRESRINWQNTMDVLNVDELPAKIKPTDFTLCIQCQEIKSNDKLSKPRDVSSVETYVSSVNRRSQYGKTDFIPVSQRLRGLIGSDLLSRGVQWHRTCYANTTNKSNIDRDEKLGETDIGSRKRKGRPSTDVNANTLTRSSSQTTLRGFTVNTSNKIPFTRLGLDHAQEQQNKNLKGQGAISGITQSPATLLKFCMCAPELARIASEAEKMVGIVNQTRSVHHCLNQPTILRQEWAIKNLHDVLAPCNIFTSNEQDMYKLMTKEIIPKSAKESILAFEKQGSSAMKSFVEERICGDSNLWDKIPKCLMSRLLIIARSSRQIDLEDVIGNYEFSVSNRVLMKLDGLVHPTVDKSKVIALIEKLSTDVPDAAPIPDHYTNTCLIIDAMAVVQELMSVKPLVNCVSSQEEADTLMILHATHAAKDGFTVHIMSPDTDVLLLALRRVPLLGDNSVMIMGVGERRRVILLEPIYNALGSNKASALPKWHALTGSDTTGHIYGKSKKACFEGFLKASPSIITAISALGIGSEPSKETIQGCVSFLCSLFCKKGITITQPHTLRWTLFKQHGTDKGVDMLPPTFGAWLEHIKRAHCQAAIWEQDLVLNPVVPDPTKLGWTKQDDRLVPELSKIASAPAAVVELVRCSCGASNPKLETKENLIDVFYQQLKKLDIDGDACTNMVACSAVKRTNNAVRSGRATATEKIISGFMSYGQVEKLLNSTRLSSAIQSGLTSQLQAGRNFKNQECLSFSNSVEGFDQTSSIVLIDELRPMQAFVVITVFLSFFTIITFENDPCNSSENTTGICMTPHECEGTPLGSCAGEYGVCCVLYINLDSNSSFVELQMQLTNTSANRTWNIQVTQIACDSPARAPSGCLQYFMEAEGIVQSFNYESKTDNEDSRHLANQRYTICVRNAADSCAIQWEAHDAVKGFDIAGSLDTSTTRPAEDQCYFDYVIIPGHSSDGNEPTADRQCGQRISATDNVANNSPVISKMLPFILGFFTDDTELSNEVNAGFSLKYKQITECD